MINQRAVTHILRPLSEPLPLALQQHGQKVLESLEGLDAEDAVTRPRLHPTPEVVEAEPGVDEDALLALEAEGRTVRRWEDLHHYFGGVGCVGRTGAAGRGPRGWARRRRHRVPPAVCRGFAAGCNVDRWGSASSAMHRRPCGR